MWQHSDGFDNANDDDDAEDDDNDDDDKDDDDDHPEPMEEPAGQGRCWCPSCSVGHKVKSNLRNQG